MVLGAPLDTGNLGVSALGTSAVKGLRMAFPHAEILLEMHRPCTQVNVQLSEGAVGVEAVQLHVSRQLRARCGTRHVGLLLKMAGYPMARWLAGSNRTARQVRRADVVLDTTAGDSFTDLYGPDRWRYVLEFKRFMLAHRKPLVLAPQTFGPFEEDESGRIAQSIIEKAMLAATRDCHGLQEAEEQFGQELASRMVARPDMAFLLDPIPVPQSAEPFALAGRGGGMIGLNISGLYYFGRGPGKLALPYPELIDRLVEWCFPSRIRGCCWSRTSSALTRRASRANGARAANRIPRPAAWSCSDSRQSARSASGVWTGRGPLAKPSI